MIENKKYPHEAKCCKECVHLNNDTILYSSCKLYGFIIDDKLIKNCDRSNK